MLVFLKIRRNSLFPRVQDSSKHLRTPNPGTKSYVPEDLNPQEYGCENIESQMFFLVRVTHCFSYRPILFTYILYVKVKTSSEQVPLTGLCKHDNELPAPQEKEICDQPSDYQFSEKTFTAQLVMVLSENEGSV